jgi:hypothetical protein
MLNLADLGFLLSILAGGVGAAGGASAEGASTFGVIACGVSGLLLGGALGAVANKLSYWLLDREPPNALLSVLAIVSYSVWPLGSSIGVGILAGWLGGSLVASL